VRQRQFDWLGRKVRLLGRPVFEPRAEPVRKPDDEFAQPDLSYLNTDGRKSWFPVPNRREPRRPWNRRGVDSIHRHTSSEGEIQPGWSVSGPSTQPSTSKDCPADGDPAAASQLLPEQHFIIRYGDTGHTYETIFGSHFAGASPITVEVSGDR